MILLRYAACMVLALLPPRLVAQPTEKATLKGHAAAVWCVNWSPDGKTLAAATAGGMVKLWDAAKLKEQASIQGHAITVAVYSVTWSPDSKTLATASQDQTVKLWDAAKGK